MKKNKGKEYFSKHFWVFHSNQHFTKLQSSVFRHPPSAPKRTRQMLFLPILLLKLNVIMAQHTEHI